ncbi:hypothetical protein HB943_01950 [Listeria weihenstephanensis]|uniref:Flagellar assembly protein T C-terminal domain-containing protein n=1 Tax=Listeria weihenstephanensis TaxID=1006155 RepID=A0A841Z356_9LIST|nr:hypothetical protein [Listeria weihenstephanensis]MBC1499349.1 hypothetical protein [Listeria weihenstephanensis]
MEAKIIKIIDQKRVVINAGSNSQIKKGDLLTVLDEVGEEVTDPETGHHLGRLDIYKAQLEVEIVYAKMAICINAAAPFSAKNIGAIGSSFLSGSYRPDLNVDLDQATGGYYTSKDTPPIKIGDTVSKVQ